MQKFVVVKKFTDTKRDDILPAKVKMSGYLKKKRNKVGGWRKMWFVLQNQLLLSYSSKDEYEKKLIPFKDVLNLVPGTIVRPCGGFRFTIETTTNVVYTFRCDDAQSCTEWISALMEALSLNGSCARQNGIGASTKFHISLENIRQIRAKRPVQPSISWDSICCSKARSKSPKLPIGQTTARLLTRSGLSATELSGNRRQEGFPVENGEKAQNFRLHEENLPARIQSDEVCRINQMFVRAVSVPKPMKRDVSSCSSPVVVTGAKTLNSGITSGRVITRNTSDPCGGIYNSSKSRACSNGEIDNSEYILMDDHDKLKSRKCDGNGSSRDVNQNKIFDENLGSFEEQVQRLTLSDISGSDTVCFLKSKGRSHDTNGVYERVVSLSAASSSGASSAASSALPSSSSSSSSSTSSKTTGPASSASSPDTDLYDATNLQPRLSSSSDNICKGVEPIYAVVDLKNKYARRAKIREMEEQMERERPKSVHVITSDYEEVLNFCNDFSDKDEDENENIYEPINIPEGNHQRNLMWRYFPKINIESLIEMTRVRKKESKIDPQSPFSDIKRKLGNHRKSIKNRMKRFCNKEPNTGTIIKERNAFSDDELDSQGATGSTSGTSENSIKSSCGNIDKPSASYVFSEIEKYRRGEKHIFGSLSRLKKARTSLCLDDGTSKAKLLIPAKNSVFQQELRKEIGRRSGRKKVECHSKFYD